MHDNFGNRSIVCSGITEHFYDGTFVPFHGFLDQLNDGTQIQARLHQTGSVWNPDKIGTDNHCVSTGPGRSVPEWFSYPVPNGSLVKGIRVWNCAIPRWYLVNPIKFRWTKPEWTRSKWNRTALIPGDSWEWPKCLSYQSENYRK